MEENRDVAIVLVSGGMDSLVVSGIAQKKHQALAFLHLDYGNKTHNREKKAFNDFVNYFKPHFAKSVDMNFLSQIGGSSLTDHSIKIDTYQGDSNRVPTSYVPFRNAHFLSMAVSWAEVIGAKTIYIGANEEDSPGYPDCRPAYYQAFNQLIKLGTKEGNIKIETPIIHLTKKDIIKKGNELSLPFQISWSCYAQENIACGICDSCALRLRGFREAGLKDPIKYADK